MLTRHSPPRAVGCAEAGWLVGESDGRSRPSSRPSDRPNFQDFPSPFMMRAPVGIVRRAFPQVEPGPPSYSDPRVGNQKFSRKPIPFFITFDYALIRLV